MNRLATAIFALVAAVGVAYAGGSKDEDIRKAEQHAAEMAARPATNLQQLMDGQLRPFAVMAPAGVCDPGTPGLIIHDDGVAENGTGWNASAGYASLADRFTPATYPATIGTVCVSLIAITAPPSVNIKIAVYNDSGAGGSPGTLLGSKSFAAHPATISGVPATVPFEAFDISDLNLTIASGNVYVAVEWDAAAEPSGFYLATDESASTPYANGYYKTTGSPWTAFAGDSNFGDIQALFIRAAMPAAGPGAPSVAKAFAPTQVLSGVSSTLTITLNNGSQPTAAVLSADLTDNLPAGLVVAATPNAVTTCTGGTLTATAGGSAVTLSSGAAIPANGTCTVKVDVSSATDATYTNTIAAGALQTQHGNNASAATATLKVGLTFPEPYCPVTFPSGVEPITKVVFADISNNSPATGGPAHQDFTAVVGNVTPGATVQMTVKGNTAGNFKTAVNAYIDWNQDGVFDPTEKTAIGVLYNSTGVDAQEITKNITIPLTALSGTTRMRVIKKYGETSDPQPCNNAGYGQAEDYTLNVAPASPAPKASKAFAPAQVMANAPSTLTITLNNADSPTAATLISAFADALPTGLVVAATPNASTTCANGTVTANAGDSVVGLSIAAVIPGGGSCAVTVDVSSAMDGIYVNTIHAGDLQTNLGNNPFDASATLKVGYVFPEPYCPISFPAAVEPISKVVFADIDNTTSATVGGTPALENFTAIVGHVMAGDTIAAVVKGNTGGNFTTKIRIYVDWNQNGVFTDAGESYDLSDLTNSTGVDAKESTGNVLVPLTALTGNTRMRVTKKFSTVADPCNTAGYGQAEDYTLLVMPPLPSVSKAFNPATVNENQNSTLTITVSNPTAADATLTAPLVDTLPAGMTVSAVSTDCGLIIGRAPNSLPVTQANTITLPAGITIPAGGSCHITATVQSPVGDYPVGTDYVNIIPAGALQTNQGNSVYPAEATLTVMSAPAEIQVNPASLSASQAADTTTTQNLAITNLGGSDLDWTIAEAGNRPMPQQAHVDQPATENIGASVPASAQTPRAAPVWTRPMATLYDNGPLITHPGAGAGGKDVSALQGSNTGYGSNISVSGGFRIADDFTVPSGGWTINTLTVFAYQTGSGNTSTITGVNLRIWNGVPGAPGSTVVFGDDSTNRMASTAFSNIYRTTATALTNADRPIMAVVATVNTTLAAGTYWADWQMSGSVASGPWAPAVTLLGQNNKPGSNAVQWTGSAWAAAVDSGSGAVQDYPFLIDGTAGGGGGPANCSNPSDVAWLSVAPASGTTPRAASNSVTVTFDSTGMNAGTYDAAICVASNDPANPIVSVPVSMTVTSNTVNPLIEVDPGSLSVTQFEGETATQTLTIASVGGSDLNWSIDEALPRPAGNGTARPGASSPFVAPRPNPIPMAVAIDEGFNDITTLTGAGWFMKNNSAPIGTTNWFQGSDTVFPAYDGGATAYIGANFNNTAGAGVISNWLLTPEISLTNGTTVSFWTRTSSTSQWADRLQVRVSTAGASTNVGSSATSVGDFTSLVLEINEVENPTGYPNAWTQYTATLSGIPGGTTGRIAFRYYVSDGGPGGNGSNYIGIDRVQIDNGGGGGGPTGDCSNLGDLPWLSLAPATGTNATGTSTDVTVTFDGTVGPGSYSGTLCVNSNDPLHPVVAVPVSMTVNAIPGPSITVDPGSLGASQPANTLTFQDLTIGNTGGQDLVWNIDEEPTFNANPSSFRNAAPVVVDNVTLNKGVARPVAKRNSVPVPMAPTAITQSTDNTPGDEGLACGQQGSSISDNSWWRRFYFNEHPAVAAAAEVQSVTITTGGIEYPGGLPSTINLYTIPHATTVNTIPVGSLTLIGTATTTVGGSYTTVTVPVTGTITNTVAMDLVVEWHTDGGAASDFYPGANALGETHSTFISSTGCGIASPVTTASIGYPDFHLNMIVTLDDGILPCTSIANVPWLEALPTSGTTTPGTSDDVTVGFDSTGLAPGSYHANLCVNSNDAAHALVPVPVTLDVITLPNDIFSDGFEGDGPMFEENFDSYSSGAQMHGVNGWHGWEQDAAAGALVSNAQAHTAPNSVAVAADTDLVHQFSGMTSGKWVYSAWQFIPASFSGESYFIALNTYDDSIGDYNWSMQVAFDSASNTVNNEDGASGGSAPLVKGQWVQLRLELDLDADIGTFFYNGTQLYSGTWSGQFDGGNGNPLAAFGAIDLFANGASPIYYDDIRIVQITP